MTFIDFPDQPPWFSALLRGFCRRCPRCGEGKLFKGYLKTVEVCENCQLDLTKIHSADDGPAYFTMSLILFIFVPILLWLDIRYELPTMVLFFVFLPLTAFMTLFFLPLIKGAFIAAAWKTSPESKDP